MQQHSQFTLLGTRRFLPLFVTQFLGALNDNLFKNALIVMLALKVASEDSALLINLAAGLFVLPFFLFSAQAGQIAERCEKAWLMRRIKLAEVAIMTLAAAGFLLDSEPILMGVLFLMGAQSALFGPVKYAILPQHLRRDELVGGNGLIEAGTFVAILVGSIAGALLIARDPGSQFVAVAVLTMAALGYLASRRIPAAAATNPGLPVGRNPLRETVRVVAMARKDPAIFKSILGISWFWLMGAAYLTQVPILSQAILGGNEGVITLLLVIFTVGIGAGSLLCERLSGHKVDIGLVPFGSIGLSLFGIDLFFALPAPAGEGVAPIGPLAFLADPAHVRMIFDLFMLGAFGGFFTVPLYALIQSRVPEEQRARTIAANNIVNAAFMVVAALAGIALISQIGLSVPQFLLVLAIANIGVAIYIYTLVPEFLLRFLAFLLSAAMYRLKREGLDRIPEKGAALLVCNHVSFVDAILIFGSSPRPIRFVMEAAIFRNRLLGPLFRAVGAVPIAPRSKEPEVYEAAFQAIRNYLDQGELVCIFPEGMLTRNGAMNEFRGGTMRILKDSPVPVVPMALRGLWGSLFSRADSASKISLDRLIRRRIELVAGPAIPATKASPTLLYRTVATLRGENA